LHAVNTTSKSNSRGKGVLTYELLLLLVSMIWGSALVAQQIGLRHTSTVHSGFITGFYILLVPVPGMFSGTWCRSDCGLSSWFSRRNRGEGE
jgi:hypothetical protein